MIRTVVRQMVSANTAVSVPCWICGAPAGSAEHRLKKADLVRGYGKGSYRGPSAPIHVRGGKIIGKSIPGADAKQLKYQPSLCKYCNDTRTQPFDNAYDRFISWALDNEDTVLRDRRIDFKEVYGDDFERGVRNLRKYFAKSFGCRLVNAGQAVPRELVAFLLNDEQQTGLQNSLTISEDFLALPPHSRRKFIAKGHLEGHGGKKDATSYHSYVWDEQVSWLMILHVYNLQLDALREPAAIDGRYVRLDSVKVWSSDEYAEVQAKFSGTDAKGNT